MQLVNLTPKDLIEARTEARENVLLARGEKPTPEAYIHSVFHEYPAWLVKGLGGGLLLIVAFAWGVSATRLYTVGHAESLHSGAVESVAIFTGIVLVLLSELTVLGAVISRKVLFSNTPENAFPRNALAVVAVLATLFAVSANFAITRAHERVRDLSFENAPLVLFVALEACIPLIILAVSLALEQLILKQVRERQLGLIEYKKALNTWEAAGRDAEKAPDYQDFLRHAIYDRWYKANAKGRGGSDRIAAIDAMPDEELLPMIQSMIDKPLFRASGAPKVQKEESVEVATVPDFLAIASPVPNGNGRH